MAEISIDGILAENKRRLDELVHSEFDPITGWQSVGDRFLLELPDYEIKRQWLPVSMRKEPFVKRLIKAGSVRKMLKEMGQTWCPQSRASLAMYFVKLRCQHDFPYWAASFAFIKNKHGGDDIRFKLTYPQRKFVGELEKRRLEKKPIRLVMLKARQWGGSTTSQLYMAWLQFTQLKGWNSLIIAQQNKGSYEIKDMFDRMLKHYPLSMLHDLGETYRANEPKTQNVDKSGETVRVIARNAKIKVGSAESPDSCRGGDYALVHLSEVGLWKKTEGKSPEDIVRSACAGVLYRPNTMIVYESTANGVGNFFHREYNDAKENPKSQFDAFFVPWFDIGEYLLDIEDERSFAEDLVRRRGNTQELTNREEPGAYYWQLWQNGATLQGINWYMVERGKVQSHSAMAAEYPSDDVEAFVNSGAQVFDKYLVDRFRPATKFVPRIGELVGDMEQGEDALKNLHFVEDSQGAFKVWSLPDPPDDNAIVKNQYLVVVDIGGRGNKADWSVICVIDRIMMMEGGKPHIAAQWRGHLDIDLIAWKAVQIASFYDDALLVIESNTIETHDRERIVEGDQSGYIFNQIRDVYSNLYARKQSDEEIRQGLPRRYGFHTNIATKPMVISTLVRAVRDELWIERDGDALDELLQYERKPNGSYGAILGAHDDILMTRAIGLHVCFHEMDLPSIVEPGKARVHYGSDTISAASVS